VVNAELEGVLTKYLARVKAPEDLTWGASPTRPVTGKMWAGRRPALRFAFATVAAGIVALCFLWLRSPAAELRSTDPAQIASWLKSRSFDVPLRPAPPSSIRVTAAHVKGPVAEVDYLVAGRNVVLTVSPPSSQPPATAYHVVRSHLVRGQLYTLSCAFPQDARTACLLCHAGAEVN